MNSPFSSTSAESFCLGRPFNAMCGLPKVRFMCASMRLRSESFTDALLAAEVARNLERGGAKRKRLSAAAPDHLSDHVVVDVFGQGVIHGPRGRIARRAVDQP